MWRENEAASIFALLEFESIQADEVASRSIQTPVPAADPSVISQRFPPVLRRAGFSPPDASSELQLPVQRHSCEASRHRKGDNPDENEQQLPGLPNRHRRAELGSLRLPEFP